MSYGHSAIDRRTSGRGIRNIAANARARCSISNGAHRFVATATYPAAVLSKSRWQKECANVKRRTSSLGLMTNPPLTAAVGRRETARLSDGRGWDRTSDVPRVNGERLGTQGD